MDQNRILIIFLRLSLIAGYCLPVAALAQATPAIIDALKTGDITAARTLVKSGTDVNSPQGDGATALHWAAHRDDQEAARLLIDSGANVNAVNELGATPLWLGAINGSSDMLEQLLEAGANPNVALSMGETPLMAAARSGNPRPVKLLLEAGANVNTTESEKGQDALMWAVAQQHADVVKVLISHGADLHARSKIWYQLENTAGNTNPTGNYRMAHGGSTPLIFVARNGDIETARVLIEAGSDVKDTEASGASALVIAAHSDHGPLAEFLLDQGADPNTAEAGYTALHAAVLRSQIDLVKALLRHGADINAVIEHGTPGRRFSADYSIRHQLIGSNALWLAAKYGEVEILQILLEEGADPFFKTERGETILQVAMGNSGSSLDHRRDRIGNAAPDLEDEEHRTLELARVLINLGVDVTAVDDRGYAALHHAVLKDFPTVVEYLIIQGADINLATQRGQTPLQLAITLQTIPGTNGLRGTRPEIAELLGRLGAN